METFSKTTRRFLTSVIKQRMVRIANNVNRKNAVQMHNRCANLKRLLEAHGYKTDELMANFVKNHAWEIQSIIPGKGSMCSNAQYQRFLEILEHAQQITNNINQAVSCQL